METLEDKQNYLRSEIIDKGYNPDLFQKFLSDLYGEEEVDLTQISGDLLKSSVSQFQSRMVANQPQQQSSEPQPDQQSSEPQPESNENQPNPEQQQPQEHTEIPSEQNQYNQDPNMQQQYNQDPNMQQQYNMPPQQYMQDPNMQQQYMQNPNMTPQQYMQDPNMPPQQYMQDPNMQQQYNQNPNMQQQYMPQQNMAPPNQNIPPANDTIPPLTQFPNKIDTNKYAFGDYCENINCVKEEARQFAEKEDMFLVVSSPEAVKKSFFSSKYYQYKIQIMGSEEPPVIRKLEDFEWLSQKLSDCFPGSLVPPLAPSHINLKSDSVKKVCYLNRFMNAVAEVKLFRSSEIFTDFLTMSQEDFNQKRKTTLDKLPKPKNMRDYHTMEGYIQLYITQHKEDIAKNLNKEMLKVNDIYKKLDDNLDIIMKQFDEIAKTFNEISKNFGELAMAYEKLNDQVMMKGLGWFRDFMQRWSDGYKEQKDFFMQDLKYYFKYVSKEFDLMMPLYDSYKDVKDIYEGKFKSYVKVLVKNEKEEIKVVAAKKSYSYYLKKLLEEYDLLRKRHQKRLAKQFIILSRNKGSFIKDYNAFNEMLNFGYE